MTRGWQILVVMVATAAGCGDNKPLTDSDASIDAPAGRTPVERGRYIMNNLAACTFCHTPLNPDGSRDLTRLFAGVDCFVDVNPCLLGLPAPACVDPALPPDPNDGIGCLSTRNLTNDTTGLKNATDAQIKDAFRNGHRTDGKTLVPVMPYYIFHNISDEDADAIVAYLRSVPGIDHTVKPVEPPWDGISNGGDATLAQYIDPSEIALPAGGTNNESAMRGRYLTGMAGLCIDCHTPGINAMDPFALFPRPIAVDRAFSGGRVFTKEQLGLLDPSYPEFINVRNLTPSATGLKDWTLDQIKNAIAKGKDQMGNGVCAATHGSGISPYAALDPQDLDDIAEYVHQLAPIDNDTGTNCQGPPVP